MVGRREILKRDNCTCQRCSLKVPYGRDLVVHKVDPTGSLLDLDNLVLLCERCKKLVSSRGYTTLEEIQSRDPKLDGIIIMGKLVPVLVAAGPTDWHKWVYGSGKRPE